MEIEHNVFLARSQLPSAEQLQEALREHQLAVVLPAGFDPAADDVAVQLQEAGEAAELQYYANPVDVAELLQEEILHADEAAQLGGRDFLVSVVANGERQRRAADALAAALCALADGQLAPGGEPPFIDAAAALAWARQRRAGG